MSTFVAWKPASELPRGTVLTRYKEDGEELDAEVDESNVIKPPSRVITRNRMPQGSYVKGLPRSITARSKEDARRRRAATSKINGNKSAEQRNDETRTGVKRILEGKMRQIEDKAKSRAENARLSEERRAEAGAAEVEMENGGALVNALEESPKTKPYSFDDIVKIYSERGDGVERGSIVPSWAFPLLLVLSLLVPAAALVSVFCTGGRLTGTSTRLLLPMHKSA